MPGAIYFVTTCLEGSISAEGCLDLLKHWSNLDARIRPKEVTTANWELLKWKWQFAKTDEWLDFYPAARHLADFTLAKAAVDALFHFAGVRYDLLAYCIMPSHYHWVFRPCEGWIAATVSGAQTPRQRIRHSVNRFSAHVCNRLLNRKGVFWQHESYDHWVRDLEELARINAYVELNPVKAGLVHRPEEWLNSSAHYRYVHKIESIASLIKPHQAEDTLKNVSHEETAVKHVSQRVPHQAEDTLKNVSHEETAVKHVS